MELIARGEMRPPGLVIDVELAGADPSGRVVDVSSYNSLWCLYRLNGIPHSISIWDVQESNEVTVPVTGDGLNQESVSLTESMERLPSAGLTVVICTRDRPAPFRRTLESLKCQTDTDFDVLVVENAPSQPTAMDTVRDSGISRCDYVLEPIPGVSRARNRGLTRLGTEYVAWLDDDEAADPSWVYWIKRGLSHDSKPDAVCGLMLPAELETEAQIR